MTRRTKRVLAGIGGGLVVLIATPFLAIVLTMAGDSKIQNGEALGTRGKQVADGFVSVGLIDVGGGAFALVDCGDDKDAKVILADLAARQHTADDVKAIFVTHGHPDHVRGCAKFPKADVYAYTGEKELIEGRSTAKGMMPKMMGTFDSGVKVKHEMTDREEVTVGDVKVTAFALPGHTVASAVYLIDGVLYFGDGASAHKDGYVTPAKYLFSDDQKQDIASLKSLASKLEPRASEIAKLEFAHTGTLAGFEPLRAFAKSH